VAVHVLCPHCRAPCRVAEQHLGVPVQCGRCARRFLTRSEPVAPGAPPAVRLDIGTATSEGRIRDRNDASFLVRHLVWSNLDECRELAMLVVGGDPVIRSACASLTPLLGQALNGASTDALGFSEAIGWVLRDSNQHSRNAAIAVVWDGQVYAGRAGDYRLYHHQGGQRVPIAPEKALQLDSAAYRLTIAPGDWLVLPALLDRQTLRDEIAKAPACAAQLAQQLVERMGQISGNSTVVVALRAG
jgi:hypothetical protein